MFNSCDLDASGFSVAYILWLF